MKKVAFFLIENSIAFNHSRIQGDTKMFIGVAFLDDAKEKELREIIKSEDLSLSVHNGLVISDSGTTKKEATAKVPAKKEAAAKVPADKKGGSLAAKAARKRGK